MPYNILLITMGGTIGAQAYSEKDGEYPINTEVNHEKCVENAFKIICENNDAILTTNNICNKDSKCIDNNDLENLSKAITSTPYDRIIVTIGTDKMCEIAQNLQNQHTDLACPVIFTGSIWPLANGAKLLTPVIWGLSNSITSIPISINSGSRPNTSPQE